MNKKTLILAAALLLPAFFCSCSKQETHKATSIAVFVPGIMADSPIYANLAKGIEDAVQEYNASLSDGQEKAEVYVMEAGTNQAEWATKLTSLAAAGTYGVIISSNPSLPEIAQPLTERFPQQKFIFLDAALDGNNSIACISYDQTVQSYLSGYIAGLFSKTHKVGLIAAQEYPVMNNILHPYFAKGAADAVSGTTCDFRLVGNWYDGAKGAELTDAMFAAGVDVILPICGGASQGVISSATEHNIHLTWFDENAFAKAPGVIISCCMVQQRQAAKETTLNYLAGKTNWGNTKVVGFTDGYIEFITDDPLYTQTVPQDIRNKMDELIRSLKEGSFSVPKL